MMHCGTMQCDGAGRQSSAEVVVLDVKHGQRLSLELDMFELDLLELHLCVKVASASALYSCQYKLRNTLSMSILRGMDHKRRQQAEHDEAVRKHWWDCF